DRPALDPDCVHRGFVIEARMLHEEERVDGLRLRPVDDDAPLGNPVSVDYAEVLEKLGFEALGLDPAAQRSESVEILEDDDSCRVQLRQIQDVFFVQKPAGQLCWSRRE